MDNTTLTIIGMIAAFLTASITPILTESVKSRLQYRSKLRALRVALYKEMFHNYAVLPIDIPPPEDIDNQLRIFEITVRHAIRTECYQNVLQHELEMFYALKEANVINKILGSRLARAMDFSNDVKGVKTKLTSKQLLCNSFLFNAKAYIVEIIEGLANGALDINIVKEISTPQQYQAIMDRIKEYQQVLRAHMERQSETREEIP